MNLYFLRHGDALSQAADDASRPLSPLGRLQATIAGRTLARLKIVPGLVLASPLLRARQTAELVMKELHLTALETTEYLTPTTDPRQLVAELNARAQASVLLVGHLPSLQTAASLIVSGTRDAGLRVMTGTLIGVETPPRVEYGSGVLQWLFSYEQMKAMLRGDPPRR
jgi:phosphohistidine phosphatase